MTLKTGIYKSTKGNILLIAEDGRNLYATYNDNKVGTREKWPIKYKTYEEFVKGQGLVRTGDFNGLFF
jgi:hypothetical protein